MFQIGKTYTITLLRPAGLECSAWTVLAVDGPLIKVVGPDPASSTIFNTTSYAFVRAEPNNNWSTEPHWGDDLEPTR